MLMVPVVNVHGFLDRSRYLPDRRDLNRSFPGTPTGSIAARLAHTFTEEVVFRAGWLWLMSLAYCAIVASVSAFGDVSVGAGR